MFARKSKRIYAYNRAVFLTLHSSVRVDLSGGVQTELKELWVYIGAFRKNWPLFDFDCVKFGKCWSCNITVAGLALGIGAIRERTPFFGMLD